MRTLVHTGPDYKAYITDELPVPNSGEPLLEIEKNAGSEFYRDDDRLPSGRTAADVKAEFIAQLPPDDSSE